MHPDPTFREDHRAALEHMVNDIGFAEIFATTPEGPRVAHTPVILTNEGKLQFHLARTNGLSPYLETVTALVVVNGPSAYISPRWYSTGGQVPTWNYVALELEGRAARISADELDRLLIRIGEVHEGRLTPAGKAWRADDVDPAYWNRLAREITGFEMTISDWRATIKLSQNKTEAERRRIAEGLAVNGSAAMAAMMRDMGQ